MRWFVYPDLEPEQIEECRAPFAATYFSAIPRTRTFLDPLLEQVERTQNPDGASYFLVPAVVDIPFHEPLGTEFEAVCARFCRFFPFFSSVPERHVFFLLGDNASVPASLRQSVVFMPSCSRTSRALPLCYFAQPPATEPTPIGSAEFDVSFQGAITTGGGIRARVAAALCSCHTRSVCCRITEGYFHATYDASQQRALRDEYRGLLSRSRFVLCPRGDGLTSLRFFESLAFGRLPVLIADDAALPLERDIPYNEFMIRVPESQVESWEVYLDAFLATHHDLEYCSSLARNAFQHWFSISSLRRFVETSLRERRVELTAGA
jgi:hypothetical protein